MREEQLRGLVETRALRPVAIAEAADPRRRPAGPLGTTRGPGRRDAATGPRTRHRGPVVAVWHHDRAPGYDLYYLNVMAGPGERAWRFTDDPAHAWIRDSWAGQELDPRLPLSSPVGRPT